MTEYRYEKLTWLELKQAVADQRVVLMCVATLEDHGHHLPVDTDVLIGHEMLRRTCELIPDQVLLLPPIYHGYTPHHMDFPGTITIQWKTLVEYCLDITRSLARHGFRKMLLLNSHGSNDPFVEAVARLTMVEHPEVQCAMVTWWQLRDVQQGFAGMRASEYPGGTSHACELETSIYLAVEPERVQMDKAVRDIDYPTSPHFWEDLMPGQAAGLKNPVRMMEWWSTQSRTGTQGDATKATAHTGEVVLRAASQELAEIIGELRARPWRPRVDHHVTGGEGETK